MIVKKFEIMSRYCVGFIFFNEDVFIELGNVRFLFDIFFLYLRFIFRGMVLYY